MTTSADQPALRSVDFDFYDGRRLRTVFPFAQWTLYNKNNEILGGLLFEKGRLRTASPRNAKFVRTKIEKGFNITPT